MNTEIILERDKDIDIDNLDAEIKEIKSEVSQVKKILRFKRENADFYTCITYPDDSVYAIKKTKAVSPLYLLKLNGRVIYIAISIKVIDKIMHLVNKYANKNLNYQQLLQKISQHKVNVPLVMYLITNFKPDYKAGDRNKSKWAIPTQKGTYLFNLYQKTANITIYKSDNLSWSDKHIIFNYFQNPIDAPCIFNKGYTIHKNL